MFGAPIWETREVEDSEIQDATNGTSNECDQDQIHYGGSGRTIDGIFKGSKKKAATIDLPTTVPIITKEPILDEQGLPTHSSVDIYTPEASKSKSEAKVVDPLSGNESSDDEFLTNTKLPATKERSAPKRQASAKKTKYTVDLLDSDVEEEDDSDGDEKTNNPTNPAVPTTPKAPARRSSSKRMTVDLSPTQDEDGKRTKRPKKAAATTKKKVQSPDELSSNNSKETNAEATKSTRKASSAKTGRKPRGKQQPKKLVESFSDQEAYASSDEEEVESSNIRRSSTRVARGSASKKQTYKEDEDSDDNDDGDDHQSDDKPTPPPKSKRMNKVGVQKDNPIELSDDSSSLKKGKSNGVNQRRSSAAAKRCEDEVSDQESILEVSKASGPAKRARAKKASVKTSLRRSSAASTKSDELADDASATEEDDLPVKPLSRRKKATPKVKVTPRRSTTGQTPAKTKTNVVPPGSVRKEAQVSKRKRNADAIEEIKDESSLHPNGENHSVVVILNEDDGLVNEKPPTKKARTSIKKASDVIVRRNSTSSVDKITTPLMESPSPSVLASPFRSRRRKSPGRVSIGRTTSAKRTVFDLSEDAEFSF